MEGRHERRGYHRGALNRTTIMDPFEALLYARNKRPFPSFLPNLSFCRFDLGVLTSKADWNRTNYTGDMLE